MDDSFQGILGESLFFKANASQMGIRFSTAFVYVILHCHHVVKNDTIVRVIKTYLWNITILWGARVFRCLSSLSHLGFCVKLNFHRVYKIANSVFE